MSDPPSRPSEPSVRPGQNSDEAALVEMLAAMFSPRALYTFIRLHISDRLANDLPVPDHASRSGYAAIVAEKIAEHDLDARFREQLRVERARRSQAAPAAPIPSQHAPTEPAHGSPGHRALGARLRQAEAERRRLAGIGADTSQVTATILQLKRALRRGGQLRTDDSLSDGRYLLLESLGKGGFATVWRARDQQQHREVAIKVLHSNLANEPVRRGRFFRGARIMAELEHPGIVRVHESHGEDDGYYYFVMELASGGTLHQAVLQRQIADDARIPLILALGQALAVAHAQGYVHRDVKPANVLMTDVGEPRLTDFDLVAATDTTGGTRTGAMGTVVYAAPEQLTRPQDADVRADIYSLAMTAAFVLHGEPLSIDVIRDAPGFIRQLQCSPAVAAVLARAASWNPDGRFSSMDEFCDALEDAASQPDRPGPAVDGATPDLTIDHNFS